MSLIRVAGSARLVGPKLNHTSPSGLTLVPEMFLWEMSVIFEINRDFPYQVALSFDEIAMEVLRGSMSVSGTAGLNASVS